MSETPQPLVAISACLLGQNVRHDGGHKKHDWLVDQLASCVSFQPLCPEMEMGLGTPRESLRLIVDKNKTRLVTTKDEHDLTALAESTAKKILDTLDDIDGVILKKNSPSCGIERVKLYRKNSCERKGTGIFAAALKDARPDLPSIEEGRLDDPAQREHFVTRVFAHRRWRDVTAKISDIQLFHQRYKLLLMSHSPKHYKQLGNLAANSAKRKPAEIRAEYETLFLEALKIPSNDKRRVNVLQHMLGYFKNQTSAREKQTQGRMIEEFRNGDLSFLAALESVRQLLHRFPNEYLEEQLFFDPYPKTLQLRRHL